jgi:hypothetical protein
VGGLGTGEGLGWAAGIGTASNGCALVAAGAGEALLTTGDSAGGKPNGLAGLKTGSC